MSWAEVQILKNEIAKGTRALPLIYIVDTDGSMGGKTINIIDENELFLHTVVFPRDERILPITLEYLCEWEISFQTEYGEVYRYTIDVDKVGGVIFETRNPVGSWTTSSDSVLIDMIARADRGELNIFDYWHVGDEREVTLSAMAATGVGESHVEQTVTLVLMHAGGKTLNTPTESGRTECSFIVGMKDCLKEMGYINSSDSNAGGWSSCARRTWCNTVFKGALPVNLAPIFKQFENKTSAGNQSTVINTDVDWFALPSEIEIFGSTPNSASGEGAQFTWYKTAANRIKKVNGSAYVWWERSPYASNTTNFCQITSNGSNSSFLASRTYGLAPFGVI